MVKVILCALFALCLAVDIYCLQLEQCPPGYRCRPKIAQHRFIRSVDFQVEEEVEMEMCEAGTYSLSGATECIPCENGTYAAHPGAPGCYVCPKGHMCPQTNMEPEQCPLGTYNSLTRQTCCRSCPSGKFALLKGMSQCYNCPSGYKCAAKPKLACEENGTTTESTSETPIISTTSATTTTTSLTTVTTATIDPFTPSTVTCSSTVATSCTTTTTLVATCQSYEVSWNNHCYYLDGSGGTCATGYSLATNAVLTCIATQFAGLTYQSTVSGNCCIWTADTYECYGMSSNCNSAGPFTSGPALNGAGCLDVQNQYAGQLTFCGSN